MRTNAQMQVNAHATNRDNPAHEYLQRNLHQANIGMPGGLGGAGWAAGMGFGFPWLGGFSIYGRSLDMMDAMNQMMNSAEPLNPFQRNVGEAMCPFRTGRGRSS